MPTGGLWQGKGPSQSRRPHSLAQEVGCPMLTRWSSIVIDLRKSGAPRVPDRPNPRVSRHSRSETRRN